MDRAGALEILMPALQPPKSGSKAAVTKPPKASSSRPLTAPKKNGFSAPTHEEAIATLMAGELSSYRQLPKNFYQIQTKFRDEIRPRFGLMRTREFIMKDAYSFDATDEACAAAYQKMFDSYTRIFQRCGLQAIPVEADTGVMGGKFSMNSWSPPRPARTKSSPARPATAPPTWKKPPAAPPNSRPPPPLRPLPKNSHPRRPHH